MCFPFFLHQVMQADAVFLLNVGNMDIPPSWARPETVIIHCESASEPGMTDYILHASIWAAS